MNSHVRALGALHIVCGSLGVLAGLICLVFFGGLAGLVGLTDQSEGRFIAVPILGAIAGFLFLLLLVLSLPGIIAGAGLLGYRAWARILTIILSAIHLLNFPIGTALGVYGFWVLLSREGEQLFASPPVQPARV